MGAPSLHDSLIGPNGARPSHPPSGSFQPGLGGATTTYYLSTVFLFRNLSTWGLQLYYIPSMLVDADALAIIFFGGLLRVGVADRKKKQAGRHVGMLLQGIK